MGICHGVALFGIRRVRGRSGAGGDVRRRYDRRGSARSADLAGICGYEKIAGTVHFGVDPNDLHNRIVVDLDKAPRNAAGLVEFSADMYLLRPKDAVRSNGAALVEVSNRGGRSLVRSFNRGGPNPDPTSDAELGDRFLMRFGFTLATVGWEFDVSGQNLLKIQVPVAINQGKPITGVVRAAFTPAYHIAEFELRDLPSYDVFDPAGADST